MKERDVSDNDWSQRFTRRSTNTTKNRGTEERVVRGSSGSPNARGHRDERSYDGNRPPAEAAGQRYPDEVCETQDQDRHANEVDDCRQRRVEVFHVVRYLGSQRQRTNAVVEGAKRHGTHSEPFPRSTPVQRIIGVIGGLWHKRVLSCMLQVYVCD